MDEMKDAMKTAKMAGTLEHSSDGKRGQMTAQPLSDSKARNQLPGPALALQCNSIANRLAYRPRGLLLPKPCILQDNRSILLPLPCSLQDNHGILLPKTVHSTGQTRHTSTPSVQSTGQPRHTSTPSVQSI